MMRAYRQTAARVMLCMFIVSLWADFAPAQTSRQSRPPPIRLGQISLSFYRVKGAVVQEMLERLGHAVEVREGAHEEIFPVVGRGEVDLLVAAWLPEAHGGYWRQYGENLVELGTLYEDARFFWGVPDYVPEAQVRSIADLAKPEVAARMTRTIQGIGPGSTITVNSRRAMNEYGLAAAGYTFRTGTAREWMDAFERAVQERRWVVIPLWQPHYLNSAHRIRRLADPRGVMGGVDHAALVAHKGFVNQAPPRTLAVLRRIRLDIAAVTEMDRLVNVEGRTPREAAREWMRRNPRRVRAWTRGSRKI
jgi:glycine betaine/proline transport system substrate-binding protein